MFGDIVKIAAKAALIVVVMTAIVALFTIVQIPTVDLAAILSYLNTAYAFMTNWSPALVILLPIGITLIILETAIMGVEVAAIAWRWIFKINE